MLITYLNGSKYNNINIYIEMEEEQTWSTFDIWGNMDKKEMGIVCTILATFL